VPSIWTAVQRVVAGATAHRVRGGGKRLLPLAARPARPAHMTLRVGGCRGGHNRLASAPPRMRLPPQVGGGGRGACGRAAPVTAARLVAASRAGVRQAAVVHRREDGLGCTPPALKGRTPGRPHIVERPSRCLHTSPSVSPPQPASTCLAVCFFLAAFLPTPAPRHLLDGAHRPPPPLQLARCRAHAPLVRAAGLPVGHCCRAAAVGLRRHTTTCRPRRWATSVPHERVPDDAPRVGQRWAGRPPWLPTATKPPPLALWLWTSIPGGRGRVAATASTPTGGTHGRHGGGLGRLDPAAAGRARRRGVLVEPPPAVARRLPSRLSADDAHGRRGGSGEGAAPALPPAAAADAAASGTADRTS